MCCAGVGTLSAHKMTTGRVSHQQISPIKGQIVIYRPSIGPDSLRDALRATFVGDWKEPSGESRSNRVRSSGHSHMHAGILMTRDSHIIENLGIPCH